MRHDLPDLPAGVWRHYKGHLYQVLGYGSGTTAEACVLEGMRCVGVEAELSYLPLAVARVSKPLETTLDLDV